MPPPYSNDLRWRAIWMVEVPGYSVDEVATFLERAVYISDLAHCKLFSNFMQGYVVCCK